MGPFTATQPQPYLPSWSPTSWHTHANPSKWTMGIMGAGVRGEPSIASQRSRCTPGPFEFLIMCACLVIKVVTSK